MKGFLSDIMHFFKGKKNVIVLIIAALLVELFSAFQYHYARNLLEKQLAHRAESELRIKAILIKNMLNTVEKTMSEHIWDIKRNISHPDSMFDATSRIFLNTPEVIGSCLAFVPDYYPEKGRLFEPYAYKKGNDIKVMQLAATNGHDYTQHPAYKRVEKDMKPFWSDPYHYEADSTEISLTTYSYPLTGEKGLIAIGGLDLSLEQIGDTLNARHIYPSSFDLLLTESGELISGPSSKHSKAYDLEQVVQLINDSAVKRAESLSGLSKVIKSESKKNKANFSVYYATIKGNPRWQIAVVCYDSEVYHDLVLMRIKMFFLMLLGFGVLGFIINRFVKNELKLNRAKSEQERIGSELRIAKDIQMGMLPKDFPPFPDRNDIQIYGSLNPAKEIGGDIYDFFLRDEKLFFCIGDVSGKGVPSAIVMAGIHSQFHMASVHENNPAHIMQSLNTASCEGNESNIFVTFFIGVLDLPTGRLRYCNAGHDIPYILSATDNQEVVPLTVDANIPIGLFDDYHYKVQETYISNNSTIFLYTDGLTEAKNPTHQQFGIQEVEKILSRFAQLSPEELIQRMDQFVHLFMERADQSDDLTMLAIKYIGQKDSYTKEEITLNNEIKCIKDLNAFVKSITDKLGIETSQARNIKLAVEEAVVNVMDYAYPSGTTGNIVVRSMYNDRKLKFVIIDSGVAFDPTKAALADTSLSVEERPVGGLGLLLVRNLMDSINYERIENKNTLTLMIHYNSKK